MQTPIYDFLQEYAKKNLSRLHMPGHKGKLDGALNIAAQFDVTEVTGADVLFCADGIIEQSETATASLYKSKHTCFSTQGSTACIMAMIRLVAGEGDTIISARNVHHAFINACALLGVNPQFTYPTNGIDGFTTAVITASQIKAELTANPTAKAVYITSPDYLGVMSDIAGIASVCNEFNVPLLVDNAHGAYLPEHLHPITNGATLCCDSAHKTLPVLTGGAYLHTAVNCQFTKSQVKDAMALFSSTSPSYLTLMSLDLANKHLAKGRNELYLQLVERTEPLQNLLEQKGFSKLGKHIEPAKLTIQFSLASISESDMRTLLLNNCIEPEYCSSEVVVLMFSANTTKADYKRVEQLISQLPHCNALASESLEPVIPKRVMSVRQAVLSANEIISIGDAVGRIASEIKLRCPPGIPLTIPGEIIDVKLQKFLKRYSIFSLSVIK